MANLTISVDGRVLGRARARASAHGTSVNALLGEYLAQYAGSAETAQALAEFREIARSIDAGSGAGGRTWRREDLHDRPNLR